MSATLDPLVMDLVAFVAAGPRPYDEVMDAWRTSCPRLTVWEDAVDRGLVAQVRDARGALGVSATNAGLRLLRESGRLASG
jgi:hypothetical protein